MHLLERRDQLIETINKYGRISVRELKKHCAASPSTLQRDLKYLEDEGVIRRKYGAISIADHASGYNRSLESPYEERTAGNREEKARIGKLAGTLIQPGDAVYFTHGTTTLQVARHLPPHNDLTVFTDGIDIVMELGTKSNARVFSLGGHVNYSTRQIEMSPYIPGNALTANIGKLFMGVGGISEQKGVTFYDYVSFSFLEGIMPNFGEVIVVADHTKFGKVSLAEFISLDRIHTIVTDSKVDHKYADYFESMGIRFLIA